ncbi:oxidase [Lithospermum erythrorhizon]|uniref:Oxidase n=1 Tax=Lithospermum erythrorhizon TaxID=34254 RepID=A0AAV3Q1D3_LITER
MTSLTFGCTFQLKVTRGKTYLLRLINAALNTLFFFKIANHDMIVVAADAVYTNPYFSEVITIAPGQTTDVLFTADQPQGSYYMATSVYRTSQGDRLNEIPATGIIVYEDEESTTTKSKVNPKMPDMPDFHDTTTSYKFYGSLTSLVSQRFWSPVPHHVDERLFITTGLSLVHCEENHTCIGPLGQRMAGSLNNVSFLPPSQLSILEAHYYNKSDGIFTMDFPANPTHDFDYSSEDYRLDEALVFTQKATKVKKIKFNSTVEIVFQTTGLVAAENHPMHLHGYNFHVLGQGFGNFDPIRDQKELNFVNPQIRNTFDVPIKGWAVIRFRANNPGAWYMHCHIEAHLPIGLAVVLMVEDGPTPSTKLPPPPQDLPRC